VSSLFPAQYCSAPSSISLIINILLGFLGIVSVLFIIIGGYRMVVSNGNEDAFKKGRETVVYAVIGMLVAIFAFAIITIIGKVVVSGSSTSSSSAATNTATPAAPASTTPASTTTSPSTTDIPSSIAAPTNTSTQQPSPSLPPTIAAPGN
jgi:hypothetical protein